MRIIIRMIVIYREQGVGARSAKVLNLSAKTKYKFDRRPRAVFDGVSAGVSTYYQIYAIKNPLSRVLFI